MKNIRKVSSSLAFRIIGAIICLLLIYNLIVQTIGYFQFTESLTNEYNDSAFRTAETAVTLVNGDRIEEYGAVVELNNKLSKTIYDTTIGSRYYNRMEHYNSLKEEK